MESCHSLEVSGELKVQSNPPNIEKEEIYVDLQRDTLQQKVSRKFARHMMCGLLWISGGGLAAAASMGDADAGVIPYFFLAAVIFGMFGFVKGLIGWSKRRQQV